MKLVSVRAYDNTIVRVPIDKLEEFNVRQNKIKQLLDEGKSIKEIMEIIKEDK